MCHLSIADRATISNMCPEYGATVGFFPVDDAGLSYLRETGRHSHHHSVHVLKVGELWLSKLETVQPLPSYLST